MILYVYETEGSWGRGGVEVVEIFKMGKIKEIKDYHSRDTFSSSQELKISDFFFNDVKDVRYSIAMGNRKATGFSLEETRSWCA